MLPAARDAIRREGVIVRLDDRVNPCLAISPPLICTGEHLEEAAAGIAAGLAHHLDDLDLRQVDGRLRVLRPQVAQRLQEQAGDGGVAHPAMVGGDDVPRRPGG